MPARRLGNGSPSIMAWSTLLDLRQTITERRFEVELAIGVDQTGDSHRLSLRHPREIPGSSPGRGPELQAGRLLQWMPAFAGMTKKGNGC
jgi:hypothetical protein